MSMKPRKASSTEIGDVAKPVGDAVTQTKTVDEFGNIPGTVTSLKRTPHDTPIPGVVSTNYETD